MMNRLERLKKEHDSIEGLDLLTEEGRKEAEKRHLAYFDALGKALGYKKSPSGMWIDNNGLATNVAMMESRLENGIQDSKQNRSQT